MISQRLDLRIKVMSPKTRNDKRIMVSRPSCENAMVHTLAMQMVYVWDKQANDLEFDRIKELKLLL